MTPKQKQQLKAMIAKKMSVRGVAVGGKKEARELLTAKLDKKKLPELHPKQRVKNDMYKKMSIEQYEEKYPYS